MTEINPGVWDGLSPDEAREKYPEEWERFLKDPYAFRAPRAESYHDLSVRLEPILIELEREQEDLLIISHASVIRCLLAYLIGLPASEIPAIEIARGDLIEVRLCSLSAIFPPHLCLVSRWFLPRTVFILEPSISGMDLAVVSLPNCLQSRPLIPVLEAHLRE